MTSFRIYFIPYLHPFSINSWYLICIPKKCRRIESLIYYQWPKFWFHLPTDTLNMLTHQIDRLNLYRNMFCVNSTQFNIQCQHVIIFNWMVNWIWLNMCNAERLLYWLYIEWRGIYAKHIHRFSWATIKWLSPKNSVNFMITYCMIVWTAISSTDIQQQHTNECAKTKIAYYLVAERCAKAAEQKKT